MAWFDQAVAEGFVSAPHRRLLQVDADLDELFPRPLRGLDGAGGPLEHAADRM